MLVATILWHKQSLVACLGQPLDRKRETVGLMWHPSHQDIFGQKSKAPFLGSTDRCRSLFWGYQKSPRVFHKDLSKRWGCIPYCTKSISHHFRSPGMMILPKIARSNGFSTMVSSIYSRRFFPWWFQWESLLENIFSFFRGGLKRWKVSVRGARISSISSMPRGRNLRCEERRIRRHPAERI